MNALTITEFYPVTELVQNLNIVGYDSSLNGMIERVRDQEYYYLKRYTGKTLEEVSEQPDDSHLFKTALTSLIEVYLFYKDPDAIKLRKDEIRLTVKPLRVEDSPNFATSSFRI